MLNKKDYKLFLSLCLWGLIPSLYNLIRMQLVSFNGVDINILGQMEWFDLIDEILITTLTVPLYSLLNLGKDGRKNTSAYVLAYGVYVVFTAIISLLVGNIATFMNAEHATHYLLLQSFSMLLSFGSTLSILLLTLNANSKFITLACGAKWVLLVVCDLIFINMFKDIGSVYSEMMVNTIMLVLTTGVCFKKGYLVREKLDLSFVGEWAKVGVWAGIQIFLDNFIYAVMVCKMVNAVAQSGNYWVANNFIWGWLLVSCTYLCEVIKKNRLERLDWTNTFRFLVGIIGLWAITYMGWGAFLRGPMASDSTVILPIVQSLMIYYVFYLLSSVLSAWFISRGLTYYNTIVSVVVNIVYYGIMYMQFNAGAFTLDINFIIMMFGNGMVVNAICSTGLYVLQQYRMKKNDNVQKAITVNT